MLEMPPTPPPSSSNCSSDSEGGGLSPERSAPPSPSSSPYFTRTHLSFHGHSSSSHHTSLWTSSSSSQQALFTSPVRAATGHLLSSYLSSHWHSEVHYAVDRVVTSLVGWSLARWSRSWIVPKQRVIGLVAYLLQSLSMTPNLGSWPPLLEPPAIYKTNWARKYKFGMQLLLLSSRAPYKN